MSKAHVNRRRASASSLNPSPPSGIEATFEGLREHSREHSPRRPSLYCLLVFTEHRPPSRPPTARWVLEPYGPSSKRLMLGCGSWGLDGPR